MAKSTDQTTKLTDQTTDVSTDAETTEMTKTFRVKLKTGVFFQAGEEMIVDEKLFEKIKTVVSLVQE